MSAAGVGGHGLWMRAEEGRGEGRGRRMDSGIFLPRFRLAPLKAGCRYLMR